MEQTYINIIFSVFMTLISAGLTLAGKLLAKSEAELQKRMAIQDEKTLALCIKMETLREDFNREALHVQRDFVTKEDYLNTITKIDAKMDRTISALHNIDKTLAKVVAKGEGEC